MNAVIYARFSTENQDEASIDDQDRRCRVFAKAKDINVINVYSDAAVSGTTTRREGLQRLLADAKAHKFKALLVDDLARLSRDRIDSGVLVRQLDDAGVVVYDVATGVRSDDEQGDIVFAVKSIADSQYVKSIQRNTHRGLEGRALQGFHTGGKTFGYSTVTEPNPANPEHARKVPVIDQGEAELVRRIFATFAAGKSARQIAADLNTEGVPAPHDGGKGNKRLSGWGHTTIRSMLRNRRYLGELTWNATKWKKTSTGARRKIARPESEHVTRTVPELAVIVPELWERVQARIGARKAPTQARAPRNLERHMLSGLLTCGSCGGSFGVVSRVAKAGAVYRTLGCVTHKSRGNAICPNAQTISEKKVSTSLLSYLQAKFTHPDRVQEFIADFQASFADLVKAGGDPVKELDHNIARQREVVANVTTAFVGAPMSKALGERLAVEEQKLSDLEGRRQVAADSQPKPLPHPTLIASFVTDLTDTMQSGDVPVVGALLRSVLAPFRMVPEGVGYRLVGAIDLSRVRESISSGGVI